MISILLTIPKILGIILLVILGIILTLLLLVLFVPIRYRIKVHRKTEEEAPVAVNMKVTWLLHILNAAFSYPEAAYIRVRIFFITVFRSDKPKKSSKTTEKFSEKKAENQNTDKEGQAIEKAKNPTSEEKQGLDSAEENTEKEKPDAGRKIRTSKQAEETAAEAGGQKKETDGEVHDAKEPIGKLRKLKEFFTKLFSALKNIQYTITKICDKIKHVVNNIQYYLQIIKSDTFSRAWKVCSGQVFGLLKSILPRKVRGNLHIGTGDPASTGQVLAACGILYPMLGNHINIIPDFEQQIIEGELFVKGKITVFKALKTAWIVYFNKDLRRLIKLFKREAV